MECFSFDLSSATDRWPLVIMFEMFQYLFGRSFASAVVNSALATNLFHVPFVKGRKRSLVCFVAGQPLGYYASWPLFALSHHLLVWACAHEVYLGRTFLEYAVLGDDVLIADERVATLYRQKVEALGVTISEAKSLVSSTGCAEFAKRFLVNGLRLDLSPISARCLSNYFHPHGLSAIWIKYPVPKFSTFCRIGGVGFKSLARLPHMSLKLKRRHAMWARLHLPLDLWLGRGMPLNPYLEGRLIYTCVRSNPLWDLEPPPREVFKWSWFHEFLEYTMFRSWMTEWLAVLKWGCMLWVVPPRSIKVILENMPVMRFRWNPNRRDENLVRFGWQWKCYDLVERWGVNYMPGVLPYPLPVRDWLPGGASETSWSLLRD